MTHTYRHNIHIDWLETETAETGRTWTLEFAGNTGTIEEESVLERKSLLHSFIHRLRL